MKILEAYVQFVPNEQLVDSSKYIVVAKVKTVNVTDKVMRWGEVTATVVKNELQVVELIKGTLAFETPFILNTFKYDGWMEDNVKLPSIGLKVILFLKRDKKGELKPVNGIQGVWSIYNGKPMGAGHGTTLKQIREIVQKQVKNCKSEVFTSLVDTAEIQTEIGHYKEALEVYRKAYRICPMKDLEEQMAWLMDEVEDKNILPIQRQRK
jgi:hypothetical protein